MTELIGPLEAGYLVAALGAFVLVKNQISARASSPQPLLKIRLDEPAERRQDPRFAVTAKAWLETLNADGECYEVEVLEMAARGLRIRQNKSLKPETCVQLLLDGDILLGRVVHCRRTEGGYDAGIRLEQRVDGGFLEKMMTGKADERTCAVH